MTPSSVPVLTFARQIDSAIRRVRGRSPLIYETLLDLVASATNGKIETTDASSESHAVITCQFTLTGYPQRPLQTMGLSMSAAFGSRAAGGGLLPHANAGDLLDELCRVQAEVHKFRDAIEREKT